MVRLEVREDYNLENLKDYGFKKQDYLMEYGRKEKTGCNVWRFDDVRDGDGYVVYHGITIFEKTPRRGYFAPDYDGDDSCAKARVVYMMADNCYYMERCKFEFNPKIYDLISGGVIKKVEEGE